MAYTRNRNNKRRDENEIEFKLMEHIGVLEERDNGWTKEVNIVAWNGGPGKIDIRDWDPDHERMSRGITMYEKTAEKLAEALWQRYFGKSASETAAVAGGQA